MRLFKKKPVTDKEEIIVGFCVGDAELSVGKTFYPIIRWVRRPDGGYVMPLYYETKLEYIEDKIAAGMRIMELDYEEKTGLSARLTTPTNEQEMK